MRILLVTPAYRKVSERWMPLSFCYIAAVLLAGKHDVKIFDRFVVTAQNSIESANRLMIEEIKKYDPDIIGFGTITAAIYDTIAAVKLTRQVFTGLIVLGGYHVTTFPELTLERIPEADAVIVGEGEESLLLLANQAPREEIPGLFWRDNGIQSSNIKRATVNLDKLPLPAYHLLDMEYYTKPNVYTIRPFYLRVGSMLASRGCNNRCLFCTESLTYSGGVRFHHPDYVTANAELLLHQHQCNGIAFLDNDFLANRSWAEAVLGQLIARKLNRKLKIGIQTRVTHIDPEIAHLLREAGCRQVELGVETGDGELLGKMKKNATIAEAEKAIRILHENQISVQANLMMGFEGETLEKLEKTLFWVKQLKIDNFKWGMVKIYPGSQLYVDKGKRYIEENEWTCQNINSFFSADHLTEITKTDREKWLNTRLKPYKRYLHHRGIWRRNSVLKCIAHYYHALSARRR